MKQFKILVCGDRKWANIHLIRDVLALYDIFTKKNKRKLIVIEGCCRDFKNDNVSADRLAEKACAELGIYVEHHPAQWVVYGKAAGPIRNNEMADQEPDVVLAFHNDLANSKGTKNMVDIAKRRGLPVWISSEHRLNELPLLRKKNGKGARRN